jgi:positive regulator of sigma E activity
MKPIWKYLDTSDVTFALVSLGIVAVAFIVMFLLERKINKRRDNQSSGGGT